MNPDARIRWNEDFDEPWRRLPWIVLGAILTWVALLGGFAHCSNSSLRPNRRRRLSKPASSRCPRRPRACKAAAVPPAASAHAPAICTVRSRAQYRSRWKNCKAETGSPCPQSGREAAAGDNGTTLALSAPPSTLKNLRLRHRRSVQGPVGRRRRTPSRRRPGRSGGRRRRRRRHGLRQWRRTGQRQRRRPGDVRTGAHHP